MNESTTINSTGFSISSSKDNNVKGFYSYRNDKIEFLPENFAEKFPNLVVIWASRCSIKKVSKKNFRNLRKLRGLDLDKNQIERIESDTFDDLIELEELHLGKLKRFQKTDSKTFKFPDNNMIKAFQGKAFAKLVSLENVYLESNDCIDQKFTSESAIAEIEKVVNEKCGACGEYTVYDISTQLKTIEDSSKSCKLQESIEIEKHLREISTLKAELDAAKASKMFAESQSALIAKTFEKVEAQLKETCEARMDLKLQEISNLMNQVEEKTVEISNKNDKIKQLEKKAKICDGQTQDDGEW